MKPEARIPARIRRLTPDQSPGLFIRQVTAAQGSDKLLNSASESCLQSIGFAVPGNATVPGDIDQQSTQEQCGGQKKSRQYCSNHGNSGISTQIMASSSSNSTGRTDAQRL